MRKNFIVIVLIIVVPVFIVGYFSVLFWSIGGMNGYEKERYVRKTIESVGGADEVLIACRTMLGELESSGHGELIINMHDDGEVKKARMPGVLIKLNASEIHITDHMYIYFKVPKSRSFGLVAFQENAIQFGTAVITNGLWYWNGYPSKETRKVYQQFNAGIDYLNSNRAKTGRDGIKGLILHWTNER